MRGRAGWGGALAGASAICACAGIVASCRAPTEVTITLTTDVPCSQIQGTTVTVGQLGDIESSVVTTSSELCDSSGSLGTLVLVPSGARNEEVAFRVVAGVGRTADSCVPPAYGPGCIVARRSIHYIPHTPLRIGVALRASCEGVVCDPTQTCLDGVCQDANIADPTTCETMGGCGETVSSVDASVVDAGPVDAAPVDAAPVDAPVEAGPAPCDTSGYDPGADWPAHGYCPRNIARSPFVGTATPKLRWKVAAGAAVVTDPAIGSDQTIWFGSNDHVVYAVDRTGVNVQKFATPENVNSPTPALSKSTVFISSSDGNLYAINRASIPLAQVWMAPLGSSGESVNSAVLGRDGTVFITAPLVNTLLALDPATGTQKWMVSTVGGPQNPALAADGTLYVGCDDHAVRAFTSAGASKWTYAGMAAMSEVSIGDDGTLYTMDGNTVIAISTAGTLLWSAATPLDGNSTLSIGPSGRLYAATSSGNVYAISQRDGSVIWKYALGSFIYRRVTVDAAENLYVGDMKPTMTSIDSTGKLRWSFPVGSDIVSTAAIGRDGAIYFGSNDGNLYALGGP
jgi:outer membrane protein assembly factor BamB